MAVISRVRVWLRARIEARRWLDTPAGCCQCGTGGPYYTGCLPGRAHHGHRPPVTRYLYAGATAATAGRVDWSACSRHRLVGVVPLVDYGADVVVTFRQADADGAAALPDARGGRGRRPRNEGAWQ